MQPDLQTLLHLAAAPGNQHPRHLLLPTLRSRYISALTQLLAASDIEAYPEPLAFIDRNYDLIETSDDLYRCGLGQFIDTDLSTEQRLLHFLLLLVSIGAVGEWSLALAQANNAACLDCLSLNIGCYVRVQSDGQHCTLTTGMNRQAPTQHFIFQHGAWSDSDADSAMIFSAPHLTLGIFNQHIPRTAPELLAGLALSESPRTDIRATLAQALQLILHYHPSGMTWITAVLRGIIFVTTADGSTTSGSSPNQPGLIFVSHPIQAEHLAAQLVHECAHQYFHLTAHHLSLTTGNPADMAYSPFKRTHRPLDRVLLAFHAAVNIKHLTGAMLSAGVQSDYISTEDAQLCIDIEQMLASLHANPGLTDAGRELMRLTLNG
jgi:hypothetical protein